MPLYDYRCRACSKVTEVRHGFREGHQGACPACGGELARVFSPAGIVFKGSGFYLTDSRSASEKKKATASESGTSPEAAKPAQPTATASEPASSASTTPAPAPTPAATTPSSSPAPASPAKKSESSAA